MDRHRVDGPESWFACLMACARDKSNGKGKGKGSLGLEVQLKYRLNDHGDLGRVILFGVVVTVASLAAAPVSYSVKKLPLPGANGLVTLDYFAYDPASGRVWVPAGNIGSVDVIDAKTDAITSVEGFTVASVELKGKQRQLGPSSVAVGDGVVYTGNRADSTVCIIDAKALKKGDCITFAPVSAGMAAAPDGLIYIASTKELWGTSGAPPLGISAAEPGLKIFSASDPKHLVPAGRIPLPGSAEGYAEDRHHGLFYTNLEESGQTVAIDTRAHKIVSTWKSCEDPSGVAVDAKRGLVFVACTDHVIVLDTRHGGQKVGSIQVGAGIDNIDYSEEAGLLYAAASDAAVLVVVKVGNDPAKPEMVATIPTVKGARSVIAGANGRAYLIDPYGGAILKVEPK